MTVIITVVIVLIAQWWLDLLNAPHFPSSSTLTTVNVKAYWDASHANEIKAINWGTVYLGSSYNTTIFLQSISNVRTTFELTTENWTFLNSHGGIVLGPLKETSYLNLSWDCDKRNVNPKETVQVTLTLNVADSTDFKSFLVEGDVKGFSVDIVIRAVEST